MTKRMFIVVVTVVTLAGLIVGALLGKLGKTRRIGGGVSPEDQAQTSSDNRRPHKAKLVVFDIMRRAHSLYEVLRPYF